MNDSSRLANLYNMHSKTKLKQHFCHQQPAIVIIEKHDTKPWHLHKVGVPHSKYTKYLKNPVCPFCKEDLE